MKSYIQGLITGGVLIFAFMVLTGQKHGHKNNHAHHDIDDIDFCCTCARCDNDISDMG